MKKGKNKFRKIVKETDFRRESVDEKSHTGSFFIEKKEEKQNETMVKKNGEYGNAPDRGAQYGIYGSKGCGV